MTPELLIVVDTEEEFDWTRPFSRESIATRSIPAQARAHEFYDRFGIVPTYVVDFPVATDPEAVRFLRGLRDAGKAEIGAHLHPWVTPPHVEQVNIRNSYHCNLPPELERAKIAALTEAIETELRRAADRLQGGPLRLRPQHRQGTGRAWLPGRLQLRAAHRFLRRRRPRFPRRARSAALARRGPARSAADRRLPRRAARPRRKGRLAVRQPQRRAPAHPGRAGAHRPGRPLAADPGGHARRRAMPPDRGDGARAATASSASPITAPASSPATRLMCATKPTSPASSPLSSRC